MELFSTVKSVRPKINHEETTDTTTVTKISSAENIVEQKDHSSSSFSELGLCDWICNNTRLMGFRRPTDIQRECIPAILSGKDVLGCAETGSGKTAAFALPILQLLSEDPYGIYAIVITPTRELAIQISEQITTLGASFGVRIALIIGGVSTVEQGIALGNRPHVVIATPGRLRHHLQGSDAPDISKVRFLVLDEADRLLSAGFSDDLQVILEKTNKKRNTLLFSATLTESLIELEQMSLREAKRFDLTKESRTPAQLVQQYLFMPAKVKACFLIAVLKRLCLENKPEDDEEGNKKKKQKNKSGKSHSKEDTNNELPFSVIIFVSSCRKCQEISLMLNELNFPCVALHGMLNQSLRSASLGRFKNQQVKILVATDLASRGLDIPTVNLVINMDLPKICSDYVHRVGRAARAGRNGRALSMITQYDIDIVHAIENYIEKKLILSTEVKEENVIPYLNSVAKAMRETKMKLMDEGFDDKVAVHRKRKRKQLKDIIKKKKLNEVDG